jgi:hypothetical protein
MKDQKVKAFEDDFKRACLAHGINAAFVIARNDGEKGSLLSIGGSSELSDYIERCLLPHTVEAQQPHH